LSTSNEETIQTAEKTINPPAIKQQKIKEYNNGWMTDFPVHRHEDDADTEKSGWHLNATFVLQTLCQGGD